MSVRPFRDIKRRKTKVINVGKVKIGGDNPISVQSMTNTLTTDVKATIKQINDITEEGADIVRVSCPDESSTSALKEIIKHVSVPVVADINNDQQSELVIGSDSGKLYSFKFDSKKQGLNEWEEYDEYFKELNFPVGGNPVFADMDKDGDLDLIVGSEAGTLHYFRNEGQ